MGTAVVVKDLDKFHQSRIPSLTVFRIIGECFAAVVLIGRVDLRSGGVGSNDRGNILIVSQTTSDDEERHGVLNPNLG